MGSLIRGGKGQKRKMAAKLIRKVFHQDSPTGSVAGGGGGGGLREPGDLTTRPEMPEDYLYEDYEEEEWARTAQQALTTMTQSLRIFGLIDQAVLLELMRNVESQTVKNNQYLFRVGDPDDSM